MPTALRRGLPRVKGGEPWPPADIAGVVAPEPVPSPAPLVVSQPAGMRQGLPRVKGGQPWPPVAHVEPEPVPVPVAAPEPAPVVVESERGGEGVEKRKLGRILLAAAGLVVLAAMTVMSARYITMTEWGAAFIERYNGHPSQPADAPIGFPVWLNALHFFNAFLMVLIIRTGITVRQETRPQAYWTPRGGGKKISLTLWFHQALDVVWVACGALFYILLFTTGQWKRIVPTSLDVFPNALSAGLQYLTLNWPTENGWVHYNALQLLAYFITVFIAAPLAIISGVRMSGFWNEAWTAASKAYPAPVARAIHFPVMIYFVGFIIVHVLLVFATGALRNLNHMYAARGSADPTEYAGDVTGLIVFLLSLAVMAAAWVAARPALLAPVANRMGDVSAR
ncbi:cytochrome b/b6 domain-containing protein [Corynebacterium sanguinis]|uniref:cytochrome b/b6 domain-containing protein n=1 Tax=Corynebacterium TaxID=1716 RepID=UPI00164378AB|nr:MULTISPECIES: cytochrome b/b6 domain-containing protein [Corynebacterium]MCT1413806.1 cytochrome b/b6 domain-containing protein [Corynebacterium sanguinis]MCT1425484.1 cytochrome b/b6 domain-containing protein [Corynebacterium sanguinis]MCT1554506.1 cytochrome b/b6 domain-containing protein [Corynebacterium sanguinis]MCT1585173.1 cytochrome b/b6 domain-containing protein [Corynebacterium sanguinis]MCT1613160.1 cytochrome b/b6 domain-containing protein [Corynebacterium sanguinis]